MRSGPLSTNTMKATTYLIATLALLGIVLAALATCRAEPTGGLQKKAGDYRHALDEATSLMNGQ